MRELEHERFTEKVEKLLKKLGDNSHLNTQQLAELAVGLETLISRCFVEKSVPKRTQESFWYRVETDSLGYQTGEFPRDMSYRDRDEE